MTSVDSKTSGMIENLDRISELPEPIILHILSRLPLEDFARASILSKTWKSYCSLNPILYFDQNLFALQSLVGSGEPDINQIRDMFLDDVHYHLSRATQLDSPIRKLALKATINDFECFSRLDKCLELVRHINVQDLCVILQTVDYPWDDIDADYSVLYEFPVSAFASKGLRSHVYIEDHVFENLSNYCKGIEILALDYCTVVMDSIELSKFPKLKNAVIEIMSGWVTRVDIVDTNLECFKCHIYLDNECRITLAACASIRELTLEGCTINQPSLFADLASTFPLVEEADIFIHDTETIKAVSKVLRKVKFHRYYASIPVKEAHIDRPSLMFLECCCYGLVQLYIDCPKLRVFRYYGNTVPKRLFIISTADLEESRINIVENYAYDSSWFINSRSLLVPLMASPTYVILSGFSSPMSTFEAEQVETIQASPRYNVHLTLLVSDLAEQDVAALVDAVLWVIRPTTLIVGSIFYYLLKYLCENLIKKSQDDVCGEQVTRPCWMHQLEDFQVESSLGVPNLKDNLVDLPEQCRTLTDDICFTFLWSYK